MAKPFNILVIAQGGRLQYEALLLAATLRENNPDFAGQLFVAEPQPGPRWERDPRISDDALRSELKTLGAQILPFENRHFGQAYPHGNKIEALLHMPEGEPFLFLDSDTVILSPLSTLEIDFSRPTASMQRTNTWPETTLYGPGLTQTWRSLYDKFGLTFETSLDTSWPDEYWQRYLYFNAGWFLGPCPRVFGQRFVDYATAIRDDPPEELVCQSLDPWLDQVALPLVIHSLGGGRPGPELDGLDGDVTCHWRVMALAYAREPDHVIETIERAAAPNRIKKLLKQYEPFKRMIYQNKGRKARDMFDRENLPRKEQAIRNKLRNAKLWLR